MSIPITLKSISLRNFMSFGANTTVVDLSSWGSTLIIGQNIDANSNNGAGKTTIINALTYVCFNKAFDAITLQRLINTTNATKSTLMEVRLTLQKGEDEYEIYRCRGESTNIQVIMNGEDITLDSVSGNDKMIQEIIGMSYELFTRVVIFSGSSIPFLELPVHPQRQLIEELFNITLLTEKAVKLKEIIKQTEGDINIQEAVIQQQENAVKLYNKQLKDAKDRIDRWEDDRVTKAETLAEQLGAIEGFDIDVEKQLHEVIALIKADLSKHEQAAKLIQRDQTSLLKEVNKLDAELKHLLEFKCPYCLQGYEDAAEKLEEKQQSFKQKTEKLQELEAALSNEENIITNLKNELKSDELKTRFNSYEAAVRANAAAESAQEKIEALISSVNPHIEAYEALSEQTATVVEYSTLNILKKELDHQQFLLKLLTDKNSFVRRKIINRTIPFLNARLNHYTKDIGLPHTVNFDDDMSCVVSEFGRELDFGNLSGGEKKRVNLALSLAFRDVLHHLHSKFNCLFIDEIDASLDASGVEAVFRLIKQKSRDDNIGLWVISHRPEASGRFDNTLIVRKENGFSQIILEEEVDDS